MTCTQAILSLFLLSPCNEGGPEMNLVIAEAIASPSRPESDRLRDPLRRPDQILSFFEITPGMKVLDLFSGGGYYTEILSGVVGSEGKVTAHNNEAYLAYAKDELEKRFGDGHLKNVERVNAEAAELDLPATTFDAALAVLTWHDFYYADPENGWPEINADDVTAKLCAALKPGAVLGIIDHVAVAGSDAHESGQNLHRIDPQRIKADLADSCFEFQGEINVLRNPSDDLAMPVFDPSVRGRTDRVVYKFRHR